MIKTYAFAGKIDAGFFFGLRCCKKIVLSCYLRCVRNVLTECPLKVEARSMMNRDNTLLDKLTVT
jgi:hypothetical protein